jgi:hypothetical protein
MDVIPSLAAIGQSDGDLAAQFVQPRQRLVADVIPKLDGPTWAVEPEARFATFAERVNVWRSMIVGVNRHTVVPPTLEYGRHAVRISQNLSEA